MQVLQSELQVAHLVVVLALVVAAPLASVAPLRSQAWTCLVASAVLVLLVAPSFSQLAPPLLLE